MKRKTIDSRDKDAADLLKELLATEHDISLLQRQVQSQLDKLHTKHALEDLVSID